MLFCGSLGAAPATELAPRSPVVERLPSADSPPSAESPPSANALLTVRSVLISRGSRQAQERRSPPSNAADGPPTLMHAAELRDLPQHLCSLSAQFILISNELTFTDPPRLVVA